MSQKKDEHHEGNVAKLVREELESDVYVRHAIRLGIANHSAIAKRLSSKIKGSEDALKMAVMRFSKNVEDEYRGQEEEIRDILVKTKIALLSNVCVMIFERTPETEETAGMLGSLKIDVFSVLQSQKVILVITQDEFEKTVMEKFGRNNLVKKRGGLCMLRLTSPAEIEYVPGVVDYLLDRLSGNGVNFTDLYSCYTDTNLVLERKDALKAFELLEGVCKNPKGA